MLQQCSNKLILYTKYYHLQKQIILKLITHTLLKDAVMLDEIYVGVLKAANNLLTL